MADPVISGTTAKFTVGTDRPATSVAWFVSGTPGGSATDTGGATSWAFTWDLGNSVATARTPGRDEVLDGTYNVGARAVDRYGSAGPTRWYTLRINRRAPYAPATFQAVRQDNVVWLRWAASPEGDVEGAEVYRDDLAAPVCALSRATSCVDNNLPSSGTVSYYVRASDRDPAGVLRKGDETAHLSISMDNHVPDRPINLTAVRTGTQVTLTWLPPPNGDPDLGDTVTRYRVFRDGTAIGNRYWESGGPTTLTFTDTNAADGQHQYYVVAVDSKDAESKPQGPVAA
jgi:hypothetical protein